MTGKSLWILSDDRHVQQQWVRQLEVELDEQPLVASVDAVLKPARRRESPAVVFVDLRSPSAAGVMEQWAARCQNREVVPALVGLVQRGYPLPLAEMADRCLAATFDVAKPPRGLAGRLAVAQEDARLKAAQVADGWRCLECGPRRFLTYTPEMFPLFDKITLAARHDFTILLVGETGTGKTTLARFVHEMSARRNERFLTVGCGSLPGELVESELFGHVRGAFTSADKDKTGKFVLADGGTILLDEIDVLGPMQQSKLLRVLETGEFEPVGSNETIRVNTRTIVASNVSLEELISRNQFRADLYYRLNQVKFEIPPLRQRPRDVVPLAMSIIQECCREHSMAVNCIEPEVFATLRRYAWPGNIRELRNEIRRAVLFCANGVLSNDLLSPALVREAVAVAPDDGAPRFGLAREVAHAEQDAIEQMLQLHNFNRAATARALGISRVTLYNKIRKYRIRMS